MNYKLLSKCVSAINNKSAFGFSYVQDLMEVLIQNRSLININNIAVAWIIEYSSSRKETMSFFSNNQKINLESFDLQGLSKRSGSITSDEMEFDQYRKPGSFASSHIIAIPINGGRQQEEKGLFIHGVLLMFSQSGEIWISDEQLSILHTVLNSRPPSTYSSLRYQESTRILVTNNRVDSFAPHYFHTIGDSLDTISGKTEASAPQTGLRHFSLWNVNEESGTFHLDKLFNRNTYKDGAHTDTTIGINSGTKHFLIDVLKESGTDFPDGASILRFVPFSQVKETIKGPKYFNEIGLTDENCTLVLVSYRRLDEKKVAVLYVCGLPYTIFISSRLACDYVKSLCDYVYYENADSQNRLFKQLISIASGSKTKSEFYSRSATILKSVTEATDCLIYMINERGHFALESEEDKDSYAPMPLSFCSGYLPERYLKDEHFCEWLDKRLLNAPNRAHSYTAQFEGSVNTALLAPVNSGGDRCFGYIVLFDKKHKLSSNCAFYNNRFRFDDFQLVSCCGMVFTQYQQLCNSVENRNYILQKLRHEIPSNTLAIQNGVSNIMLGIKENPIKENYLLTIGNNVLMNNTRVMLLADFFTSVDFPIERFSEDAINVNLYRFFSAYIDQFRTEAYYKGVDVYFNVEDQDNTIFVSNYFLLALINVVINAIRYAAVGTTVVIEVSKDSIVVSDVGIPIFEKEKKLIFEEGYRSNSARKVNEKGIGYGLYLSKMIIEAHDCTISPNCEFLSSDNPFVQRMVYNYIQSIPTESARMEFIHRGLFPREFQRPEKLYNDISTTKISSDYQHYLNTKPETILKWMKYNRDYNYVFDDMRTDIFDDEIYEVQFTISL